MTDIGALIALATSGIGALKGASDLASSVRDLVAKEDLSPELKNTIARLLDDVIAAKRLNVESYELLLEAKRELDQRNKVSDRVSQYDLTVTKQGGVYLRSKSVPEHGICPTCAENYSISFLQQKGESLRCNLCGLEARNKEINLSGYYR